MLKLISMIFKQNWALEQVGIKTTSLDANERKLIQLFGKSQGLTPEEMAAFLIAESPHISANLNDAYQAIHQWKQDGKIRPDVLLNARFEYIKFQRQQQ